MRLLPRLTSHLAVAALLAGGLAGCHHAAASRAASTGTTASSTTTTTEAPTTTSTAAPTTTTKPLPGLGVGAKGPAVQALEQRLTDLHYDAGKVDGTFDTTTAFAVTAFQKVTGMARTGRAADPPAMVPGGGAMRVEVDLKRQVLFLFQGGALNRILPVSTGSGQRYCVDGQCDVAVTPGGSFRVGVKILGDHVSKLGHLYNPLFFNGGIAIHGEPAVPSYPASHGCVRIPMADSLWFYNTVPKGTPVYVVGGKAAPVPFDEPAPGQPPPNPPTSAPPTTSSTTSTTSPTTTSTSTTSTSTTSTTSTTLHP
jgi:lipoprotein-anchoring transpeptidase ErfK/SrfK